MKKRVGLLLVASLFTSFFCYTLVSNADMKKVTHKIVQNKDSKTETLFINGKEIATHKRILLERVSDDGSQYFFNYEVENDSQRKTVLNGKNYNKNCYLGDATFESLICYEDEGFSFKGKTYTPKLYEARFFEPQPFVRNGDIWYFAEENTDVVIYKNNEAQYKITEDGRMLNSIWVIFAKDGEHFSYFKNGKSGQWYIDGKNMGEGYDELVEHFVSPIDPTSYFFIGKVEGEGQYLIINGKRVSKAYDKIDNIVIDKTLTRYYFEGEKKDGSIEKISKNINIQDYNWSDIELFFVESGSKNFVNSYDYYERYEWPNVFDLTEIEELGYVFKSRVFVKNGETLFTADKDIENVVYITDENEEKQLVYLSTQGTGYVTVYDVNNKKIGVILEESTAGTFSVFNPVRNILFLNGEKYTFSIQRVHWMGGSRDIVLKEDEQKNIPMHYIYSRKRDLQGKLALVYADSIQKNISKLSDKQLYKALGLFTTLNRKLEDKIEVVSKKARKEQDEGVYSKQQEKLLETKRLTDFIGYVIEKELSDRLVK